MIVYDSFDNQWFWWSWRLGFFGPYETKNQASTSGFTFWFPKKSVIICA